MSASAAMRKAKRVKDDEFYTLAADVKLELDHYWPQLKGKKVYLPCDSANVSEFWKYLHSNFDKIGMAELTATAYNPAGRGRAWRYAGGSVTEVPLQRNGDFRSPECQDLMAAADVIITNPPFSLAREFLEQLLAFGKQFCFLWILASAVGCAGTAKHYKAGRFDLGAEKLSNAFRRPDGGRKSIAHACFIQNLRPDLPRPPLPPGPKFDPATAETYDNLTDIVVVSEIKDIPPDYPGVMAVPLTLFLHDWRPHFELLTVANRLGQVKSLIDWKAYRPVFSKNGRYDDLPFRGVPAFNKAFIRRL